MKKTNVLWIVLDLIFLVIFNILFFILGGTEYIASVWISYGFIHFAYVMLILTPFMIRKGKSAAVFGFSLYSISAVYFFIEFVAGITFIWVAPETINAALFVQLCVAGLYGILFISHMIANEHTADAEEKRQYQIAYVKDASTKMKSLLESVRDKEAKRKVEKVYDVICSSPVKSHSNLAQTETQILMSISDLNNAVSVGNKESIISLADSLLIAVNDRNRQLKILN